MALTERKKIYEKIETHRKRPLITYATSGRRNAPGQIAADAVREFIDQLNVLPKNSDDLDIVINSTGGDGLASWRIMSLIREKIGTKGKIGVLVPHYAFSAATLIALGADEIYMHPMACLGPVDPQITVTTKEGQQGFSYEDIVAFAKFLEEEGKLSEQSYLAQLFEHLVKEVKPTVLGASKRSSGQSVTMAKRLLKMHMTGADATKADAIAEKLNRSFFSHGHAVSPKEARDLGLKIAKNDKTLDELLWQVYLDLESQMEMRIPFDPLGVCLADPSNAFLIGAPPTVNVPSNMPQQLLLQFWQNYCNNQIATQQCVPQDFELIQAVVESTRYSSQFVSRGKVYAARKPDLDYIVGTPKTYAQWEKSS